MISESDQNIIDNCSKVIPYRFRYHRDVVNTKTGFFRELGFSQILVNAKKHVVFEISSACVKG